jgi:hypothetical protein
MMESVISNPRFVHIYGYAADNQAAQKAMEEREQTKASGTPAGERKDYKKSTKAPGPVIGMQDERGGKNE